MPVKERYFCMSVMCGIQADGPGLCKRCGREVFPEDENAPFLPGVPSAKGRPRPVAEDAATSPPKSPRKP